MRGSRAADLSHNLPYRLWRIIYRILKTIIGMTFFHCFVSYAGLSLISPTWWGLVGTKVPHEVLFAPVFFLPVLAHQLILMDPQRCGYYLFYETIYDRKAPFFASSTYDDLALILRTSPDGGP